VTFSELNARRRGNQLMWRLSKILMPEYRIPSMRKVFYVFTWAGSIAV
jgi:hypothetical protein